MYYLGVDLGGTMIKTGVVDEQFNIIGKSSAPTAMPRPANELVDDIAMAAKEAVANAGLNMDDIAAVGVGTPGSVNPVTGIVGFAGNLLLSNYPMAEELEARLGKKVTLANDANAAAYGEVLAGSARGAKNAICITLGTGIGGGIIIDGKVYTGSNHAAGELGHMVIIKDGIECNCGRKGCWEKYASTSALVRMTKEAMEADKNSAMWEKAGGTLDAVNGLTSYAAMRDGDETATKLVDEYVSNIACGLINLINAFQPEIVCIGGAISKEGETLLAPLRELVSKESFTVIGEQQTRIVACTLGNDAGLIGAAMLSK